MVSFAVQKLTSLIRFHLFIFAFISFALKDWSKKILLQFMPKNFLPMFSSRSFLLSCPILTLFLCMVWGSILTSLIYIFWHPLLLECALFILIFEPQGTLLHVPHPPPFLEPGPDLSLPWSSCQIVPHLCRGPVALCQLPQSFWEPILLTRHICPNRLWAPKSWDLS